MNKIVLATGGFDPLHSGHINYLKSARNLGDALIVGINSDAWLTKKKGQAFMPWQERASIVQELKCVDSVIGFDDVDGTACDAIRQLLYTYKDSKVIFANGGDRTASNIPEMHKFTDTVQFEFGVGGTDKANSSSWILSNWLPAATTRPWGHYRVLHTNNGTKAKELTVEPGKSLSMQRHRLRSEFWLVSSGQCVVNLGNGEQKILTKHDCLHIETNAWHQLINPFNEPCKIVEIQYGIECTEEDIERK